jgi:hypothetical protein
MYFDVDTNVVDRKVLVPGILEKAGGAKVNEVVAGRVAVGVGFSGVAAGADGGAGGGSNSVLLGSPTRNSDPASLQVAMSAPWK